MKDEWTLMNTCVKWIHIYKKSFLFQGPSPPCPPRPLFLDSFRLSTWIIKLWSPCLRKAGCRRLCDSNFISKSSDLIRPLNARNCLGSCWGGGEARGPTKKQRSFCGSSSILHIVSLIFINFHSGSFLLWIFMIFTHFSIDVHRSLMSFHQFLMIFDFWKMSIAKTWSAF